MLPFWAMKLRISCPAAGQILPAGYIRSAPRASHTDWATKCMFPRPAPWACNPVSTSASIVPVIRAGSFWTKVANCSVLARRCSRSARQNNQAIDGQFLARRASSSYHLQKRFVSNSGSAIKQPNGRLDKLKLAAITQQPAIDQIDPAPRPRSTSPMRFKASASAGLRGRARSPAGCSASPFDKTAGLLIVSDSPESACTAPRRAA